MKRKKFGILFLISFIFIFLIIGFSIIYHQVQEQKLKREVQQLMQLDITKDRYQTSLETLGSYRVVESAIKEYLDSYASSLQEVLQITADEQFTQLLSVNNYQQDGPDFIQSRAYISSQQEKFNEQIDLLIDSCSEEAISSYIQDKNLNDFYVSLYEDLMFDDGMSNDFVASQNLLLEHKEEINQIFQVSLNVFDFLSLHADSWKIEDGEIQFQTSELLNQYNALIALIP